MKRPLYLLAIPAMLALAACRPGAAEYTAAEAPKQLRIDSATSQVNVTFAAGSNAGDVDAFIGPKNPPNKGETQDSSSSGGAFDKFTSG